MNKSDRAEAVSRTVQTPAGGMRMIGDTAIPEGWRITETQSGYVAEAEPGTTGHTGTGKLVWTFDKSGNPVREMGVAVKQLLKGGV